MVSVAISLHFRLGCVLQEKDRQEPVVGAVRRQNRPKLLLQRHYASDGLAQAGKLGYHPVGQASGSLEISNRDILFWTNQA